MTPPVSNRAEDPAQVSEETLHSFEADLPEADEVAPAAPPRHRQGALILAGMAALIVLGLATVLAWLL
jgi:hypothetical protein